MYRKVSLLVLVFVFLFTGFTYAGEFVKVDEPGGANKELGPGTVSQVVVTFSSTIPTNLNLAKEKLEYKCFGDPDWILITTRSCSSVTCPSVYPWEVPWTPKSSCILRVSILDSKNQKLFGDQSGSFAIGSSSLNVVLPNGGEELTSGQEYSVTWNSSISGVAKTVLSYSCDNGANWTKIEAVNGNPLVYKWDVPNESSTQCKVKITLRDSLNNVLISDKSDNNFTITATP